MPIPAVAAAAPEALVRRLRARVDDALAAVVPEAPPDALYGPARYALEGEGKRVRPVLVLLAAATCGAEPDDALPAALAVEVFHTFTLVHDDIMDHAPTRRGRATVHTQWDEPTAVLVGDLLMGEAYRLLGETPRGDLRALLGVFAAMVRRLCEGQALDKAFETAEGVTVEDYLGMIDRKTGALLACGLELGGLVGGADDGARAALRTAGHAAGRAFQILDDLLDVTADDARWGKAVGGDLVGGKKTVLVLRAVERAAPGSADAAFFGGLLANRGIAPAAVPEARARLAALGVLGEARAAAERYTDDALAALGRLPEGEPRDALTGLVRDLCARLH